MHEYDVTLKILLKGSARSLMRELTGSFASKWLDVELPRVQNPRMDLLAEAADGTLVHIELQSTNDAGMPLRMAEYSLGAYRLLKRFPRQIVLYVGEPPVRMDSRLAGPRFLLEYDVVDIRDLDGDQLLASEELGDNVLAILTRLRDQKSAVHEIIGRMSGLELGIREFYLQALLILAGLRGLEQIVEAEVKKVPILNDIREHKVLGREYKRGELKVLRRLLEKRFGPLPAWAEENLASRSAIELEEELCDRVLDATSLEDLLK